MTSYTPTIGGAAPLPDIPLGPKLRYEVGDSCWIHAGTQDREGNPTFTRGKVVYWFDLPDLAQRNYVVRLYNNEFMHMFVRDFTTMAASPEVGFPFRKTRHDGARATPVPIDWKHS